MFGFAEPNLSPQCAHRGTSFQKEVGRLRAGPGAARRPPPTGSFLRELAVLLGLSHGGLQGLLGGVGLRLGGQLLDGLQRSGGGLDVNLIAGEFGGQAGVLSLDRKSVV